MTALSTWLTELNGAAAAIERSESEVRAEAEQRIKALAEARKVAFRRMNLVKAVAGAIARSEDEEIAVASGLAVVRERLGWTGESEAHDEIIARFAPVCRAAFQSLTPDAAEKGPSPADELAAFEAWYRTARAGEFWQLFEVYMPPTPVVDF